MTKKLDSACPSGPCGGRCQHVVAQPATDIPDTAGFRRGMLCPTSDAVWNRSEAPLFKRNEVKFLRAVGRYRERVGVEIGKASEYGARWWSRRLVQLYEDVGLVRFDK